MTNWEDFEGIRSGLVKPDKDDLRDGAFKRGGGN
jgi:hypothetical protein